MSPRYSQVTPKEIIYDFWLVFDESGGRRLSRGEPALGVDIDIQIVNRGETT